MEGKEEEAAGVYGGIRRRWRAAPAWPSKTRARRRLRSGRASGDEAKIENEVTGGREVTGERGGRYFAG
jgi:hypothetical protein